MKMKYLPLPSRARTRRLAPFRFAIATLSVLCICSMLYSTAHAVEIKLKKEIPGLGLGLGRHFDTNQLTPTELNFILVFLEGDSTRKESERDNISALREAISLGDFNRALDSTLNRIQARQTQRFETFQRESHQMVWLQHKQDQLSGKLLSVKSPSSLHAFAPTAPTASITIPRAPTASESINSQIMKIVGLSRTDPDQAYIRLIGTIFDLRSGGQGSLEASFTDRVFSQVDERVCRQWDCLTAFRRAATVRCVTPGRLTVDEDRHMNYLETELLAALRDPARTRHAEEVKSQLTSMRDRVQYRPRVATTGVGLAQATHPRLDVLPQLTPSVRAIGSPHPSISQRTPSGPMAVPVPVPAPAPAPVPVPAFAPARTLPSSSLKRAAEGASEFEPPQKTSRTEETSSPSKVSAPEPVADSAGFRWVADGPGQRCPVDGCGKEFKSRRDLALHSRIHTDKPYHCLVDGCGQKFKDKRNLNKHSRTHTKPFQCPVEGCGKRFARRDKLATHSLRHTGERPHSCLAEGCGKTFRDKSSLTQHSRRAHTDHNPAERRHADTLPSVPGSSLSEGSVVPLSDDSSLDGIPDSGAIGEGPAEIKEEEQPKLNPVSDSEIITQIETLIKDMDPKKSYANCELVCEGLVNFLAKGTHTIPAPLSPTPDWRFSEDLRPTTQRVEIKDEHGSVHKRTLTWRMHDSATINDDRNTLGGLLPHPTVGYVETDQGGITGIVDLEAKKCVPYRVDVREMNDFISRQLSPERPVPLIGIIVMSRLNKHSEDYLHIVTVYAYRHPDSGKPVIRYADPQDRKLPLYDKIDANTDFLTEPGQRIKPDTFAPTVEVFILRR